MLLERVAPQVSARPEKKVEERRCHGVRSANNTPPGPDRHGTWMSSAKSTRLWARCCCTRGSTLLGAQARRRARARRGEACAVAVLCAHDQRPRPSRSYLYETRNDNRQAFAALYHVSRSLRRVGNVWHNVDVRLGSLALWSPIPTQALLSGLTRGDLEINDIVLDTLSELRSRRRLFEKVDAMRLCSRGACPVEPAQPWCCCPLLVPRARTFSNSSLPRRRGWR